MISSLQLPLYRYITNKYTNSNEIISFNFIEEFKLFYWRIQVTLICLSLYILTIYFIKKNNNTVQSVKDIHSINLTISTIILTIYFCLNIKLSIIRSNIINLCFIIKRIVVYRKFAIL